MKTMAYMDDIVVVGILQRDLDRAKLHLSIFCSVNWGKCQRSQLGRLIPIKSDEIQEVEEVKVLGVHLDKKLSGKTSFKNLLAKVKSKVGFWKLRDLSLRGKILIIKVVILPLLLYTCTGKRWTQMIMKELFSFLWGSRMEKAAWEVVMKGECNGGLGFPNIERFVKLHYLLMVNREKSRFTNSVDQSKYL